MTIDNSAAPWLDEAIAKGFATSRYADLEARDRALARQIAATTARVIEFLHSHPKVERLWYPHDASDAQFELSQRQIPGASGLLSFTIRCDSTLAVERFCDALQRFLMTVSWGGYESLLFPVAAVYPTDTRVGTTRAGQVPVNLVRLSIGLEEPEVLIADLAQALDRV